MKYKSIIKNVKMCGLKKKSVPTGVLGYNSLLKASGLARVLWNWPRHGTNKRHRYITDFWCRNEIKPFNGRLDLELSILPKAIWILSLKNDGNLSITQKLFSGNIWNIDKLVSTNIQDTIVNFHNFILRSIWRVRVRTSR